MLKIFNIRSYLVYYDFNVLNNLILKLKKICLDNNIKYIGPVFLPTKNHKFSILRSPHVNKNSYDQLKICIHKRIIDFLKINYNIIILIRDCFFYYSLDFKFKFLLFN
ncbi:hypothetical protein NDNC_1170 [Candidatus Nasuia deltocephalinicola]|uniref:Small ribosomal subunit protein uS10 n=1 Tax=Candidatus Nasuia deltocephalincola TaxID=1160784 RepID=A0A975A3A9_9PROT|nr:30S ribosomal protein S10 [Candidatus Nasuia deltocephalinicola]BEH03951.1 hypothetical protein NDNC_1170 [Candidatus Nasuia deltocephalinicola]